MIDLKHNQLIIGDTTTPFLHESDLPEYARLNSLQGEVVPMDEDRQLAEALQRSATDSAHGGISLLTNSFNARFHGLLKIVTMPGQCVICRVNVRS